jgi:Na+-driven multidrug efflux pump
MIAVRRIRPLRGVLSLLFLLLQFRLVFVIVDAWIIVPTTPPRILLLRRRRQPQSSPRGTVSYFEKCRHRHHCALLVAASTTSNSEAAFPADDKDTTATNDTSTDVARTINSSTPSFSLIIPSYSTLLRFLGATTLIWLSEPLLSLVDTTAVSWACRDKDVVIQLAALGASTLYVDTCLYLNFVWAMATTHQLAAALAQKKNTQLTTTTNNNKSLYYWNLQLITSRMLGVAFVCGSFVTFLTWCWGTPILTWVAGAENAASSPSLIAYAVGYAKIRTSVSAVSVMAMVGQAVCLVTGRARVVAQAVILATLVNTLGDGLLTPIYGMYGAAMATAASSIAAATLLLRTVQIQMQAWKQKEHEQQVVSSVSSSLYETSTNTSDHPLLSSQENVPLISLPDRPSLFRLLRLSVPLAMVPWLQMASYGALTIRAASFGAVAALAANSILVRCFYFLSATADSLGQAAQAFVPATVVPTFQTIPFRKTMQRLLGFAAASGTGSALFAQQFLTHPSASHVLTTDGGILYHLMDAAPYLAFSLLLQPFITVLEGAVIARRQFPTLVASYGGAILVYGIGMYRATSSVAQIWQALAACQMARVINLLLLSSSQRQQQQPSEIETTQPITESDLKNNNNTL